MTATPAQVRQMFDRIARHYNLINFLISLGQQQRWKRLVAELAQAPPGGLALDVCAGTGDIARALARLGARVVALDFSREMMAIGARRAVGLPISYVQGDALALPFPDHALVAATIGFSLRNVAPRAQLFAEMSRVVRPGGRIVILETSQPPMRAVRAIFRAHITLASFLAPVLTSGAAYRYLARTIIAFPDADAIAAEMRAAGLEEVSYRRLMFGAVAVHVGRVQGA
jgi:demethylmenaquinone methyltransferase/2-methoxy-6-polyprenyl-1,4-benzoquinol methylase